MLGTVFPFKGQMGYYFAEFSRKCLPLEVSIRIDAFLVYKLYGSTCLSSILFWNAVPIFWLSDAETIKVVSANRALFPKDVEAVSLTTCSQVKKTNICTV
jgi:hypothetical protein